MRVIKKTIDFLAVPFIIIGGISCLLFSATLAGWIVVGGWYNKMSKNG